MTGNETGFCTHEWEVVDNKSSGIRLQLKCTKCGETKEVGRRLYCLLPYVYRQCDADEGYPLLEFLEVIEEEVKNVEDAVAELYENCFIESSDEWVIPYIGDLVEARLLGSAEFSVLYWLRINSIKQKRTIKPV